MSDYCLDFCSLLNLYCGWDGIREIHSFGTSWSISDTAFRELRYVRSYAPDGSIQNVAVATQAVLSHYPLQVLSVSGTHEQTTLVELSKSLDDGEAASLTLAKHRGLVFVSDDRPALNAAAALSVPTASTLGLLKTWSELDPANEARLGKIARRIRVLASFAPPRSSPLKSWWEGLQAPP